jgi:DtxR family Mn-dependent transcriptional regulator
MSREDKPSGDPGAFTNSERRSERAIEEVLEALWTGIERGSTRREDLSPLADVDIEDELLRELEARDLIEVGRDGALEFTTEGESRARGIIRRHRLAERLVHDILAMPMSEVEANACEFEHLIAPGITESICTLLGHPAECPHGRPIPEGPCCAEARKSIEPVVVSADRMSTGEQARVAYIATRDYARLQKLTSFGISPGVTVKLHQRQPAFVLECEQTQLALEETVAKEIFVLREIRED